MDEWPPDKPLDYVRVTAMLNVHRRWISLNIEDLRPISHPFEPYAHQFGCMYDTVRILKAKGIVSARTSYRCKRSRVLIVL